MISNALIGIASACLIASANYVINEWLDAESDRNHPEKSCRPAANGLLRARYVYLEYAVLSGIGIALAYSVNGLFFVMAFALLLSGITYNVKPFRTKDKVYVDVLSEAINNPIRLAMGWTIVSSTSIPPLSLVVAYWAGGAFLMAAKRLSEYRFILEKKGASAPGMYRRSFSSYTVESLTLSCFVYALASSFGLAVFLIKYRAEFIFTFPVIIVLFAYYLHLGMQSVSVAQKPEHLHRDWNLILIVAVLVVAAVVCAFVDLPLVERVIQSRFVDLQ
jgi:4-hydroxybenzoate polyprenyltransferase